MIGHFVDFCSNKALKYLPYTLYGFTGKTYDFYVCFSACRTYSRAIGKLFTQFFFHHRFLVRLVDPNALENAQDRTPYFTYIFHFQQLINHLIHQKILKNFFYH